MQGAAGLEQRNGAARLDLACGKHAALPVVAGPQRARPARARGGRYGARDSHKQKEIGR